MCFYIARLLVTASDGQTCDIVTVKVHYSLLSVTMLAKYKTDAKLRGQVPALKKVMGPSPHTHDSETSGPITIIIFC